MESVFPNIEGELAKRNMHYRDLARVAGISDLQMYRRMRGQTGWKMREILMICDFFQTNNMPKLFQRVVK